MIEVGKVYKLNAPWHRNHGRPVFVVHSREGVSEVYAGRVIYHIVDTDDFSTEPDWDTEYIEDNLLPGKYSEMPIDKLIGTYQNFLKGSFYYGRYYFGYDSGRDAMWLGETRSNEYNFLRDGTFTENMVVNIIKYFDKNNNFIKQEPK